MPAGPRCRRGAKQIDGLKDNYPKNEAVKTWQSGKRANLRWLDNLFLAAHSRTNYIASRSSVISACGS